jgi:hypothetical protein
MDTSGLELAPHWLPVGLGGCNCEGPGYAEILVRHYLMRVDRTMNDESPLIRQWIVLNTLAKA